MARPRPSRRRTSVEPVDQPLASVDQGSETKAEPDSGAASDAKKTEAEDKPTRKRS